MGPWISDTRDHAAFLLALGRDGADVVSYPTRGGHAFLVNDPTCAASVLSRGADSYVAEPHPYRQLAGQLAPYGSSLLGLSREGSDADVGGEGRVVLASSAMSAVEAIAQASDGASTPVLGVLHELLLCFAVRMLFGVDVTSLAGSFVMATRRLEECWANELTPDPSIQPLHRDYLRAAGAQNEVIDVIKDEAEVSAPRGVVLRTLLNSYHATATALAWALWELGMNQDVQEALRAEADRHCAGGARSLADARRLPLARRVVLETLRLHPPAWNIGRIAAHDHELAGVRIPHGSHVSVSPYVMHRSQRLWSRPEEFAPKRFAPGTAAQRVRLSYLPFGAGPQRCPAARHAIEHLQILLAAFVHGSTFEADAVPVRPRGLIGLRPDPDVYLRIVSRRRAPVGRGRQAAQM